MDDVPFETLSPIYGLDSVGNRIQLPRWPCLNPTPEWNFDTPEGSILTPIATHLSPIPTYSWEAGDSISTVVPETPMVEGPYWTDSQPSMFLETPDLEAMPWMVTDSTIVPDMPETMLDSELIVHDTPGYESPDSTVVRETPQVKRRRHPVEEEGSRRFSRLSCSA